MMAPKLYLIVIIFTIFVSGVVSNPMEEFEKAKKHYNEVMSQIDKRNAKKLVATALEPCKKLESTFDTLASGDKEDVKVAALFIFDSFQDIFENFDDTTVALFYNQEFAKKIREIVEPNGADPIKSAEFRISTYTKFFETTKLDAASNAVLYAAFRNYVYFSKEIYELRNDAIVKTNMGFLKTLMPSKMNKLLEIIKSKGISTELMLFPSDDVHLTRCLHIMTGSL